MSEIKKNLDSNKLNSVETNLDELSAKSTWVKPKINAIKIEKLTEGFGPSLKDLRLPMLAAS